MLEKIYETSEQQHVIGYKWYTSEEKLRAFCTDNDISFDSSPTGGDLFKLCMRSTDLHGILTHSLCDYIFEDSDFTKPIRPVSSTCQIFKRPAPLFIYVQVNEQHVFVYRVEVGKRERHLLNIFYERAEDIFLLNGVCLIDDLRELYPDQTIDKEFMEVYGAAASEYALRYPDRIIISDYTTVPNDNDDIAIIYYDYYGYPFRSFGSIAHEREYGEMFNGDAMFSLEYNIAGLRAAFASMCKTESEIDEFVEKFKTWWWGP